MARSRVVLSIAVCLLIVSAGCNGGFLGGGPSTPADADGATATPTPAPADRAAAVRDDAVRAMESVDTYRVDAEIFQRYRGETNQTALINTTTAVNRTNRTIATVQRQTAGGRTYVVDSYLVGDRLYSGSDFYTGEYGSEWLYRSLSDVDRTFQQYDVLARQRALLSAANVTLYGTRTLNGTETQLLVASVPPDAYERLATQVFNGSSVEGVTVSTAELRYYLDVETHRPVAINGTVDLTVDPRIGPETDVRANISMHFYGYGSTVNVTLPDLEDPKPISETDASARVSAVRSPSSVQDHLAARSLLH